MNLKINLKNVLTAGFAAELERKGIAVAKNGREATAYKNDGVKFITKKMFTEIVEDHLDALK